MLRQVPGLISVEAIDAKVIPFTFHGVAARVSKAPAEIAAYLSPLSAL